MTWRDKTRRARQPRRKARALFQCGRCRKAYSNPLGHECAGGGDFAKRRRREKAGERRARETAARQARRQKEADARRARRKREDDARRARRAKENEAAAERKRKPSARPRRPAHPYESCRDADCQRVACEAWREGHGQGYAEGEAAGYAAGVASAS